MISENPLNSSKRLSQYTLPLPLISSQKVNTPKSLSSRESKWIGDNQSLNAKLKKIEDYLNVFPKTVRSKEIANRNMKTRNAVDNLVEARLDWSRNSACLSSQFQVQKSAHLNSDNYKNRKWQEIVEIACNQEKKSQKVLNDMNSQLNMKVQFKEMNKLNTGKNIEQNLSFAEGSQTPITFQKGNLSPVVSELRDQNAALNSSKIVHAIIDNHLKAQPSPQNRYPITFSSFQLLDFIQPKALTPKNKFVPLEENQSFFAKIKDKRLKDFKLFHSDEQIKEIIEGKRKKLIKSILGVSSQEIKTLPQQKTRLFSFQLKVQGEKQILRGRQLTPERQTPLVTGSLERFKLKPKSISINRNTSPYNMKKKQQFNTIKVYRFKQKSQPPSQSDISRASNQMIRSNSFTSICPSDLLSNPNLKEKGTFQQYKKIDFGTRYSSYHLRSTQPQTFVGLPSQEDEKNAFYDDFDICQYVKSHNNNNNSNSNNNNPQ